MPSVRLLKCTWRSWSSFTRSTNPFTLRPRRSSFQTTSVSVSRKWESVSLSPGRSALAPLTLSVKIRLQLALLSAASCSSRFWSSVDTTLGEDVDQHRQGGRVLEEQIFGVDPSPSEAD